MQSLQPQLWGAAQLWCAHPPYMSVHICAMSAYSCAVHVSVSVCYMTRVDIHMYMHALARSLGIERNSLALIYILRERASVHTRVYICVS